MTDLQCPARLFVARHGEALYESELLSDSGGWLSPRGRDQSRDLGSRLAAERSMSQMTEGMLLTSRLAAYPRRTSWRMGEMKMTGKSRGSRRS